MAPAMGRGLSCDKENKPMSQGKIAQKCYSVCNASGLPAL